MALVKLTDFEQLVASYLPFMGSALDFRREKEIGKALLALYDQADALAVLSTQTIAAFLWWAAHIASAAENTRGYADEIQAAITKANTFNENAWKEWLTVKYPDDLRALYVKVTADIEAAKQQLRNESASGLRKLEAEIAALEKWKRNTVTPAIIDLRKFLSLFDKTYVPPLRTLIQWLDKPSVFAKWAILPIIDAMPAGLREKAVQKRVTAMEQIFVGTWNNDPGAIWSSIQTWLVTEY